MIIRELLEEEKIKHQEISSVAFEFELDHEKEKEKKDEEESVCGFTSKIWGAFSDDEKELYGGVIETPFLAKYDGSEVLLGGIGGVATLPPYRRNGAIRECLRKSFDNMYKHGFVFSYLYPFSNGYYRQFGYENNTALVDWTIDFRAYKLFNVGGSVEMISPDSDCTAIREIYTKMNENYNLSIVRKDQDYKYIEKLNMYKDKCYIYVWKNNDGIPKAYVVFNKVMIDDQPVMYCLHDFKQKNDFAFIDSEGLKGILDFAQSFSWDYRAIKFTLPENMNIEGMINESRFIKRTLNIAGMVRVIDVKAALKQSRYIGSGALKIGIKDKYCPWNEGIFEVKFNDNKCTSVLSAKEADIEMDISSFSTLIVGTYDKIQSCYKQDIIINNSSSDIDKVFYFKPNRLTDLF